MITITSLAIFPNHISICSQENPITVIFPTCQADIFGQTVTLPQWDDLRRQSLVTCASDLPNSSNRSSNRSSQSAWILREDMSTTCKYSTPARSQTPKRHPDQIITCTYPNICRNIDYAIYHQVFIYSDTRVSGMIFVTFSRTQTLTYQIQFDMLSKLIMSEHLAGILIYICIHINEYI